MPRQWSEGLALPRPIAIKRATGTPAQGVGASEGEWRDEEEAPRYEHRRVSEAAGFLRPTHGLPQRITAT